MDQFIIPLSGRSGIDHALLGGKAATLNRLINQKMPVPPGHVATTATYEAFVQENGIEEEIERLITNMSSGETPGGETTPGETPYRASLQETHQTIQSLFLNTPFPPVVKTEMTEMIESINYPVAVRSSAQAEDTAHASWAGQYATYLASESNKIEEKIKRCWASLFNPTTLQYAHEHKVNVLKNRMGVVVQRIINADVAGVCFTRDPVTGDETVIRIEAVYGLGEGIVQGYYTPDQYIVSKDGEKLQKDVQKQEMMMVGQDGETAEVPVPLEKQKKQKLSDALIAELRNTALSVETILGFPSDIEWVVEDGNLWILQARAITA